MNNLKLSTILQVILESQKNAGKIKDEFNKTIEFYENYPDELYYTLEETKKYFDAKPLLTPSEQLSLIEINKLLNSDMTIQQYFRFCEDMLLDNMSKIYKQVRDLYDPKDIADNKEVEILFYALVTNPEKRFVPIGEKFSNGEINTGSDIYVNKLIFNARDFMFEYQTINN